jgi:hypothetical protein
MERWTDIHSEYILLQTIKIEGNENLPVYDARVTVEYLSLLGIHVVEYLNYLNALKAPVCGYEVSKKLL